MACCRFFECLLKLLNFILTLAGLAMMGYGTYLLVEWIKLSSDDGHDAVSPSSNGLPILILGRPMLGAVALSDDILDYLPKAWYNVLLFFALCFLDIWCILLFCRFPPRTIRIEDTNPPNALKKRATQ